MKLFLTGVNCVGKSSIGECLAKRLDISFFDFDHEIEDFYGKPLGRIYNEFFTNYSYRKEACAKVLKWLIVTNKQYDYVIVMPSTGLHAPYYRIIRGANGMIIVIQDKPENTVKHLTFYDDDSNRIEKHLTEKEVKAYLKEIKKDITYYKPFYKKADYHVDIDGLDIEGSARKIEELLNTIHCM